MNRCRTRLLPLALTVILLVSCGGNTLLKSFRVALASSGPLVSSLVSSGAIDQARASAIIADFDAGAACGLSLQNAFAAIPKDAPDARFQKLTASNTALKCFRGVVARHNFAAHPRVKQAADIAEGILASLVIFYSDSEQARAGSIASGPPDEKELEWRLKQQVKRLEAAMQP